jgi:hypothetical protein
MKMRIMKEGITALISAGKSEKKREKKLSV